MPWKIVDGRMVRVGPSAPELTVRPDVSVEELVDEWICPFCYRQYKTERGLENHVASQH